MAGAAGTILNFNLGTAAADKIAVNQKVAVGAGSAVLNIHVLSTANPGTYALITDSSLASGDFTSLTLGTLSGTLGTNRYSLTQTGSGLTATAENLLVQAAAATPTAAYWGGSQDTVWNTINNPNTTANTNWLNGPAGSDTNQVVGSVSDVYETANSAGNFTQTLGANTTINSLTFTGTSTANTAGTTISAGNTLTINAAAGAYSAGTGIMVLAGSGANTITAPITLGANQTWTNNSGNLLTINGTTITNSTFTLILAGSGNTTISNVLGSGAGGLTMSGTGTATLSGASANTYTGLTTVSAGELDLAKSGAVNAIAGGGLTIGSTGSATAAQVVYTGASTDMMGTGAVTINSNGQLDFNGDSDTIGNVSIVSIGAGGATSPIINTAGGGTLTIGTLGITPLAGFLTTLDSGTGTLKLGGAVTFNAATTGQAAINGKLDLNGGQTFTIGNGTASGFDLQINAVVSNGTFTKAGAGMLQLTATNTFTGNTTISGGTLQVAGSGSLNSGNYSGTIADTAILQYSSSANQTLGGIISGAAGAVTKDTSSSSTLILTASNTFTGQTTIGAGTVSIPLIGATNTTAQPLGENATLTLGGASTAGTLLYTGGTANLTKAITIGAGRGFINNSGSGTLTLSGGINKNATILTFSGGNFIVNTNAITGASSGSDLVISASTVTLSVANTYVGPTSVIGAGKLNLGINNAIPSNSAVTLGDASTTGTLNMAGFTNNIGSLAFGAGNGTVAMAANQTGTAQLAASGAVDVGSGNTLNLTGMSTSAGLYKLISGSSFSNTFGTVTGLNSNYVLRYGTVNVNELDAQRKADQTITGTITLGRLIAGQGFTGVTIGTLNNTSPSGGTALNVNLTATDSGANPGTFTITAPTSSVAANSSAAITSNFATAGTTTLGTRNFTVQNIDNNAITGTVTLATGTVDVIANRIFTQTATNPVSFGRIISGQTSGNGISNFTTTGTHDTTVNVTVGGGTITLGGITVKGGGVNQVFNGPDGSAHTGSLTLSGLVASGSGTQFGTVTLTAGSGLTGEGLSGESDSLALAYTYDTVANRIFTQTATNPVAFGRIITGQTSGTQTGNFTTTGTLDTTVSVTVNSGTYTLGGVNVTNAGNQIFNGPDGSAHTGSLTLSVNGTGSGSQAGTLTLSNGNSKLTGEGLTGETDSLALAYTYDTVANRLFTQTATNPVAFGRVITGQTGSGTGNFTTTGTHDTTVNVTVNSGSTVISGVTVNSGSNQIFNGPDGSAHTGSVGLSLTAGGSGTQSGTVTLTSGNGALTGEGLTGESDSLALAYSYDTVANRVFTQTATNPVAFGRIISGQTSGSGIGNFTTTGTHDTTTNVTVNSGTFTLSGVTIANASNQIFNGPDGSAHTGSLTLSGLTATGSGTQFGTLTLTNGNGKLTGEGLTGESDSLALAYSYDTVANRVFTQTATNPVAFGRIISGQTSGSGIGNFTTTGTHDTTVNVTVGGGTLTLGGIKVSGGGTSQVFNGPDGSAHIGSLTLSGLVAGGSGTQFGTVTLTSGSGLTGEGLTGESDLLALAYTYDTVANRIFTQTATNPVAFGRIISGQTSGSGIGNFTTTGTLDTTVSVTVNSGTYTLGALTVTNSGNQVFNGPDGSAHTGSLTLSGLVATGSGTQAGTITLTNGNGKLTGESLTGESDSLALAYSYDTVANRVFTQTATNPVAFGRIISGQTSGSGIGNFTTTGTHDTTVNVTVNSGTTVIGGVTVISGSNQIFNGPDGSAHTGSVGLSMTAGGSGTQNGTVTLTSGNGALTGESLAGESDSLSLAYSIDTVANRLFTQTATNPVAFGRIITGQTGSGTGNFSTTGTHDTTVDVTVNSGSTIIGGVTVNSGSNQIFNGPDGSAHTGSVGLSLIAGGSGTQSGTVTLTSGNGALTGENLAGESDSLALAYSYDTVANRVFTQTATNPVAFGRIISGQTSGSGIGNFTTTGTNDTTVNVQVNSGTYTLGGVTVSNASNQIFNGPDALAHTGSLTLSGLTATGLGTQTGTVTLTNGNGKLTGEGLTGESDSLALAYSYDTVANRVFTQTAINPVDLGRVINGQTGSGTANFNTTGAHDTTVDVTVNSGSTVLGGVTVNSGSNQIFNGPDGKRPIPAASV